MTSRLYSWIWLVLLVYLGACKPADSQPEIAKAPARPTTTDSRPSAEADRVELTSPSAAPPESAEPVATPPSTALATAAQPVGDTDFFPATLVPYELRLDRAALKRLNASPYSDETCPASLLADGGKYDGVRVRYRGQWARSWPKKPFKIFLPKETPYHGYPALNLNSPWRDPSLLREVLAYHIYAACGAPAPRARVVRLLINGQFEGLYVDVEQPKRQFLKRIGMPKAAIYKALGRSNASDERDLGTTKRYEAQYEKETREAEGFDELQKFCRGLATAADAPEFFEQHVDVERLVNYLAAGVLVQNWDCYNKNHHLVHDVEGSGKWFPTPWDVDRTLGDHWNGSFDAFDLPVFLGTRRLPGVTGWNRLEETFLSVPAYRSRFLARLEVLIQSEFTPAKLYPVVDRWASQIAADAKVDRARWHGGDISFQSGVIQLKRYIEKRRAFLHREVTDLRRKEPRLRSTAGPTGH